MEGFSASSGGPQQGLVQGSPAYDCTSAQSAKFVVFAPWIRIDVCVATDGANVEPGDKRKKGTCSNPVTGSGKGAFFRLQRIELLGPTRNLRDASSGMGKNGSDSPDSHAEADLRERCPSMASTFGSHVPPSWTGFGNEGSDRHFLPRPALMLPTSPNAEPLDAESVGPRKSAASSRAVLVPVVICPVA